MEDYALVDSGKTARNELAHEARLLAKIAGGVTVVFNADDAKPMNLDQVLYKHLRCNLLREAVMPGDVRLSESRLVDGKLVADLRGGSPLTIPDFWVLHVAKAVAQAPENAATCASLFLWEAQGAANRLERPENLPRKTRLF